MVVRATTVGLASVVLAALAPPAAAQLDDDVQWLGVSHMPEHDRRPRVPMNGEAFAVRFQTFRGDVASARVLVTGAQSADASVVAQRGPYDLWEATVPATASPTLGYVIELTDGTDTDYLAVDGMSETAAALGTFDLDFTTLEHAPVGATPVAGGAVFKVWSPSRTSVHVRGSFNGWGLANPLTKAGEHFIGYVPGAEAGDRYKFFFNNSVWNSDPRAGALVPTDNYNSVIIDHDAYQWRVPGFSARPMDELVIYQLHVGTFAGRNDPAGPTPNPSRYRDVAARAGHLAELGVNAVMLNPIHEFPGDFSGGYNSLNPFSIESKHGTPDDFKAMVDALHAEGIAVLLDVVWNHVSSSDNYLWNFDGTQLYFDSPHVDTPWGAQPDFDRPGVFSFFMDSIEYMLTEYRLDGFRVDAVMYMTDSNLTPQWGPGQAIIRGMNDLINNRHIDKHTIAEMYIDSRWVTDPTGSGLGFTAQYQNEFKEAVRSAVFGAAFGSPDMRRVADVLDGQGFGVSGQSAFNYFELHDDAWNLNGHERAVARIDTTFPNDDDFARGRTVVGNSLALLSRGVPAILQGTEWLENDGWESSRLDWSHKTTYRGVFDYYRDVIALRTSEPALFANTPLRAFHVNEGLDVLAFDRTLQGDGSFVVAVNLSNSERNNYRVGLPRDGRWEVVINSSDPAYDGPGGGTPGGPVSVDAVASGPFPRSVTLDLPPRSVLILQHEPPVACAADFNGDGSINIVDVIAFINAWGDRAPGADFNGDGAFNVLDIISFIGAWNTGCV